MRRRDFIRGLMAMGVSAVVADQLAFTEGLGKVFASGEAAPRLYGDLIHDDAPALQALFDGRDVIDATTGLPIRGQGFALVGGWQFRLERPVHFGAPGQKGVGTIMNAAFNGAHADGLLRQLV